MGAVHPVNKLFYKNLYKTPTPDPHPNPKPNQNLTRSLDGDLHSQRELPPCGCALSARETGTIRG